MKNLLLIVALAIGLTACHERNVDSRPVFTFAIDPKYGENGFGFPDTHWIVIRDNETGEFVDAHRIDGSEPVEFRASIPLSGNKIAVSHLQVGTSAFWTRYCNIDVYTGVDVGSSWILSSKNSSNRVSTDNPSAGEYFLSINNVPSLYGFSVSNGISGNDFADLNGSMLTGKYLARKTPVKHLIVIDPDGSEKPKYKWIDDVNKNQSIQLDYTQFNEFDTYLNVKFPATKHVNARVESTDGGSYTFYSNSHWGRDEIETDELNIGTLNEFSTYGFSLEIDDFRYQSLGPAPQSINVSTDTTNYAYKVNSYQMPPTTSPSSGIGYSITYFLPPGSVEHEPLTRALNDAFGVKMDEMTRGSSNILLTGQTYADKLRLKFDPQFQRPETYQISWIGQNFSPF